MLTPKPEVVYLATYHFLLFSMFVCLSTSKCLSGGMFDKYLNISYLLCIIYLLSCKFITPMLGYAIFVLLSLRYQKEHLKHEERFESVLRSIPIFVEV